MRTTLRSRRFRFVHLTVLPILFGLLLFVAGCETAPTPTPTPIPPSPISLPPTPIPASPTPVPPTPTAVPPTATTVPPTATLLPTAAPVPSATPRPTVQPTLTATLPLTPTTESAEVWLRSVQRVPGGGYAFQAPNGYGIEQQQSKDGSVFASLLFNDEQGAYMALLNAASPTAPITKSPEELVAGTVANFVTTFMRDVKLSVGPLSPIALPVGPGQAADLKRDADGVVIGQAVIIMSGTTRAFFVVGGSGPGAEPGRWQKLGAAEFKAVLRSVTFFQPETPAGAILCPVAGDPTYGYSKGNPIRVGGGGLNGPPRERAYLDALRGPHGEAVTYQRMGSLPEGNTILDIYHLSYANLAAPAVLYVDEYTCESLYAPVGFTCAYAFPLAAP